MIEGQKPYFSDDARALRFFLADKNSLSSQKSLTDSEPNSLRGGLLSADRQISVAAARGLSGASQSHDRRTVNVDETNLHVLAKVASESAPHVIEGQFSASQQYCKCQ